MIYGLNFMFKIYRRWLLFLFDYILVIEYATEI